MPRLGVLGWPVAHSRSPRMHRAALAALGLQDWTYQHLPAPPELFADVVSGLPGAGFRGANVTLPHKEAAVALATAPTERARAIGAANTLTFGADGTIAADNTDAPGLLNALGLDVAGHRAVVLGAGGSARAAVYALRAGGADVQVWNRTAERARALVAGLGGRAVERLEPAELLINCTAAGLQDQAATFKHLPLKADDMGMFAIVVDLVYSGANDTALVTAAKDRGSATVDGLEVLVHQGALSFEAWTGSAPPIDVMREAARERRA
ncbi:MAG: shikimate dehydrogenase [Actinomycetota bacterium]|nr:shikimate dehydrogenase [Actinomycetota bacterium]